MEYALTATKNEARAGSYYDRIARFYDLTFKLNGYGRSLDRYFDNHPLPISRGARILDAGCGTGLLTLALLRGIRFPVSITALDLSSTSINAARRALYSSRGRTRDVTFTQGNLLSLPFADDSFDFVFLTSVFTHMMPHESAHYLREIGRVLAPGGRCVSTWFLLTDEVNERHWTDIGDATTNQVFARGRDVVVVTFVNAEGDHAE